MRRALAASISAALLVGSISAGALAQDATGEITIMTYFSADLGEPALAQILEDFTTETGIAVNIAKVGHEDFKVGILVQLAGNNPPDAHTVWAGARAAFQVQNGSLNPIDEMWAANDLDAVFPAGMVQAASVYNGQKYLLPFGYHYAGMFYSPSVLQGAGVDIPTSWDQLIAACGTLTGAGITPIAIGSKNRWPAQFWFDYLLLRTAGPEYRAKLMSGEASYTDPEVVAAMQLWQEAAAAGCFTADANAYDWTDAGDQVARGEAAMTLMGTWLTGYWNGNGLEPATDYDVFEFPVLDESIPNAVVGPVDGFVTAAKAKNPDGAMQLLAFLAGPEVQTTWAVGQGALAPNVNADTTQFSPVIQEALGFVAASPSFNFNYDLATPPAVAEVGLDMFAKFMSDPAQDLTALLSETDTAAKAAFQQ
jgi:multiple sugar transport system substrate-binding protein/raffinose/stachyose/melibiose transport system substrate-binding protein